MTRHLLGTDYCRHQRGPNHPSMTTHIRNSKEIFHETRHSGPIIIKAREQQNLPPFNITKVYTPLYILYIKLGKNNCASVRALVKQCYQSRSRLPTCFDMVHPSRKKRKGWMKNWTLFTLLFNIQKYHVNTVQLTRSPNELDMHASPTI